LTKANVGGAGNVATHFSVEWHKRRVEFFLKEKAVVGAVLALIAKRILMKPKYNSPKKYIVIVDNSEQELRLLEDCYSELKLQYTLKLFSIADHAYDFIAKTAPQIFIIMTELSMPGMKGTDLLELINKSHELKLSAIPFIFISNSDVQKDVERAYELSAQGYFQKPVDAERMKYMMRQIIDYWELAKIPR
jgi:CheY-like chemotaxis protein